MPEGELIRLTSAARQDFGTVASDGSMDGLEELVARGADIHIERMDDHQISIGITARGPALAREPVVRTQDEADKESFRRGPQFSANGIGS